MSIKSFLYLDRYKMYSISSQIFEGLTEYIMDYSREVKSEKEEQKGPVASGKLLADILSKEAGIEEKRFLHDYAYTLFEQKLNKDGKVLEINAETIDDSLPNLANYNFIKVVGKLIFNDIIAINKMLNDFAKIGKALNYVTNDGWIGEEVKRLGKLENEIKRGQQSDLKKDKEELQKKINISYLDSEAYQDPQLMTDLAYLLEFGLQDQLELQIVLSFKNKLKTDKKAQQLFSANLNRANLTESENLLFRRYGRYTESEFVIFGTVTQSGLPTSKSLETNLEGQNIKQSLMGLVSGFSEIESNYTQRLDNEIIIDPISVYREL